MGDERPRRTFEALDVIRTCAGSRQPLAQEGPRSRRAAGGTGFAKSGVPSSIGVCPAPPATYRSFSAAIAGEGRRYLLPPQQPVRGGGFGFNQAGRPPNVPVASRGSSTVRGASVC